MDYLNASDALNMLAGRKHRDDGHAAQLLRELQPNDYEIMRRAGLTPAQFSEGIDLDDAELLQSAIYQAKQQGQPTTRRITPPLLPNSSFARDPNMVEIPTNKGRVLRVPKDSLLGQNWAVEPQVSSASPIAAGTQDADFYLPMNKGLHPDHAAPGVTALTKLNAFLESDRTSTIRKDRQGQAVARQAQPGQTIRFFDDYGGTGLARVTAPGQKINQQIFTGDNPKATAVRGGPAQYIDENFIKQRVSAGDGNWDIIEPDDYPTAYGYQTDKGFVDINDPSPFPQLNTAPMTPAREAMIKLGLTEGQNEQGIRRTLFGGEGNRGIGGSGSVINYEVIPGTRMDVSQLPPVQQQRIGELQNKEDYLTDGEGFVGYKDNAIEWRKNPVFNGNVEMLAGSDAYGSPIQEWLEQTQVNPDTKTTPASIRTRQGNKSRWEPFIQTEAGLKPIPVGDVPINPQGFFDFTSDHPKVRKLQALNNAGQLKWQYVDRPITDIQTLKPGATVAQVEAEKAWGGDTSRFYQPAVTQKMLDAGLPHESQMMTADQAIQAIDKESKNQLALGNLESIDVYNKPADMRPPGSGYENYNLTFKYANTSDQMGFNDAYNQQWDKTPPNIYTHYSGGPLRYNDAGVPVGFGDKNLKPNVEIVQGTRNFLPVSDVYTAAPQHTYSEKRNIVPLQPEVADLPAMQKQQDLLKQHLDAETPKPLGEGTYKGRPMQTTGMTMGQMPEVSKPIPGAYLQKVDEAGNPIFYEGIETFPKIGPVPLYEEYTPSADLNKRSDELSRVFIRTNNSFIPYTGVAGEPLMHNKLSQISDDGLLLQRVSDTELVRDPDTMPDSLEKIRQLRDSSRNQLAQGRTIEASPNVRNRISNAGAQSFETNTIPGLQWPIGDIGEYEPTPISSLADYHIERNKLLRNINNAQPYLGDVISRDKTQILQAPFNENPVILNQPSSRRAYAGANADSQLADSIEATYKALGAIDPEMNIEREKFNVGIKMTEGQNPAAMASLLQLHGIEPVVEGQMVTGRGEMPVGERVKLAQDIRRNLAPQEISDTAIADPELAHLRNQWQGERRAVMGKTAEQLATIKQLHGERRLDRVGRPGESTVDVWQSKVNPNTAGIDRLSSAIENANYKGDDMRRNLNFYADDDFAMLGDDVHPFDRAAAARYQPEYIPNPWNGAVERMPPTTVVMEAPTQQSGVRQLPPGRQMEAPSMSSSGNWQAQMAEAMPTSDFDWNPSQAEPAYTGRGRPAPGGGMSYTPQPAAANNPWYRTKAGMAGIGGAAALTLGALAYNQMQRKQAEEDLRSQQLMAATGWR